MLESANRISFDFDWLFYQEAEGHPIDASPVNSNDRDWLPVQLPHDFSISQPVEEDSPGALMTGYISGGVGWYRKSFAVPPDALEGRRMFVEFDGIYRNSEVWINGISLGKRCNGYVPVRYDLTEHLNPGEDNLIAVRADNADLPNCRWYSGSGIHRHAWLESKNLLALEHGSVFVRTMNVSSEHATLRLNCKVSNGRPEAAGGRVLMRLLDASGGEVLREEQPFQLKAGETAPLEFSNEIRKPHLWSPETPYLYRLQIQVLDPTGEMADAETLRVGVREIALDNDQGFLLNGRSVKLKGGCIHNDGGCVGGAVPLAVWHRRLRAIKDLGANSLRMAHNPPPRELLDLCDEYGFLVMDEAFDKWEMGANGGGSWLSNVHPRFADDWQQDLDAMILRDRNHPSVVLWSMGNEVMEYCIDPAKCVETYRKLANRTKELDPSRPVSQALIYTTNREEALHESGLAEAMDLICLNYQEYNYAQDRERRPDKLILGTETRIHFGVPRKPSRPGAAIELGEIDVGIGEISKKGFYLPDNPWQVVESHDYVIGGLVWPMIDYYGEASWPNRGWTGGLIDTSGHPKTWANYFACAWSPEPRVRIQVRDENLPIARGRLSWEAPKSIDHWNWPDKHGQLVLVETPSNCEFVELLLNGESCGCRKTAAFRNQTIEWWVPYEPGTLEARGYNGDRTQAVASWKLETAGEPTQLLVSLDRTELTGDGQDTVHVDVAFADAEGRIVRTEFRPVSIFVTGHGKLLGIDNGNMACSESPVANRRTTHFGRCVGIVRAKRGSGVVEIRVSSRGFPTEKRSVSVESESSCMPQLKSG